MPGVIGPAMRVKLSIKNTFLEFTFSEEAAARAAADECLRRSSSCPCLGGPGKAAEEGKHIQEPSMWLNFAGPCSLSDMESRSNGKGRPPCLTPDRLKPRRQSGILMCQGGSLLGAEETRRQIPDSGRVSASPISGKSTECRKRTTVMIRNLPCGLSCKTMLHLLDTKGFAGLYDFIYVPMDFQRGLCMGYAFVNMTHEEHAERIVEVFHGFGAWPQKSTKVCAVSWSDTQGLAANIERCRRSPVMSDEVPDKYKPALFADGRRVPFPRAPECPPEPPRQRAA